MKLYISETIKRMRKGKGWTQEDLASMLGVTCQAVSRWENALAYPDIELLPQLSALFDIGIDKLFGVDKESEEQKLTQYKQELSEDIDANIRLTEQYLIASPRNAYFKYKLMKLYQMKGLAFAKSKLEALRKLCYAILDADTCEAWMKSAAVGIMIAVDEDSHVGEWVTLLDGNRPLSSQTSLINRYQYRGESDRYNRAIQEDIVRSLDAMFLRDFCKMDTDGQKIPSARVAGQKCILQIMDVLRKPELEVDAWIEKRAFAYLRLSAAQFGCGNIKDGYEALAVAVSLYLKYASLPTGTELKYNCASLDRISFAKSKSCKDILTEVYAYLTDPAYGWDWFNTVREEPRFVELIKPIESKL